MNISLRNTSLFEARVHFDNGHDKIAEEVIRACGGIELWVHSCRDTVFIYVSQLCQKLREKNLEEEAKWLEENCSGVIILKVVNVNVFSDSIIHEGFGGYLGQGA